MDVIIIHYSEIGTKGKNRAFFEKRLAENVRNSLGDSKVYRRYGRIVAELNIKDRTEIVDKLSKIPGIANFAFGFKAKLDFKDMEDVVLSNLKDKKFETFKINARRSNKRFKMNSKEINEQLGGSVIDKFNKKVKLKNPDLEIFVSVGESEVFIYFEKNKGIGGLPVGVSGNVISSLSGGIDSPVSSFMMMKRGCKVVFAHVYNKTVEGAASLQKIDSIVNTLSKFQGKTKLYIIPFEDLQKDIIKKIPADKRMIVYRRFMNRIFNEIAKEEKCKALITGDSVGQVASQTLENLTIIREASKLPVLSPLIGLNKDEIIESAQKIGTYESSIIPYDDCCSFMIALRPETKGKLSEIEKLEKEIDFSLIDEAVKNSTQKIVKT